MNKYTDDYSKKIETLGTQKGNSLPCMIYLRKMLLLNTTGCIVRINLVTSHLLTVYDIKSCLSMA